MRIHMSKHILVYHCSRTTMNVNKFKTNSIRIQTFNKLTTGRNKKREAVQQFTLMLGIRKLVNQ